MEYSRMASLASWPLECDQDFSLGAKATSYLPTAALDPSCDDAIFALPDWMESRENLGLANIKLFDDVAFSQNLENDISFQDLDVAGNVDDYNFSTLIKPEDMLIKPEDMFIKPEDMLVPLSELPPQTSTQEGLSINPKSLTSTTPKIIIRMKKVAVCTPTINTNDYLHLPCKVLPTSQSSYIPSTNNSQHMQSTSPLNAATSICDAEDLINEVVQMMENKTDSNGFITMNTSLDSSMVEADMDDLLSQLESGSTDLECSDVSSWGSEPASPVSIPSPVPSTGSLTPERSCNDSLFHSLSSPKCNKNTQRSSPSHSEENFVEWIQTDEHSCSSSPRKSKVSRKTSSLRSIPYPENRRERKKEQNKQAALKYRQKKKQEDDELMSQIKAEEDRQKLLKAKYSNLKQELTYLKKIMREVFIAKGVLSEDAFKKK
uniref:Activating transcription factor 4 n=1 Tax=Procambarus clarkii TaxID=6728 RepID=A0A1C9J737_PROCL|nr:activating transcription factor 4 [Procambarus clarkii]